MKTLNDYLAEKGITVEQFGEMEANEQAKIYNELNEINRKAYADLAEKVEKGASDADLDALKKEMQEMRDEQFKQLNETLKLQGIQIKKLSEVEKGDISLTFDGELTKALAENEETLKSMANGDKNKKVTLKVVGDMTISGNTTGQIPQAQRESGLNRIARRRTFVRELINSGLTLVNVIEWVEQVNPDGTPGGTAEGALKNQIDFDLVVASEKVKKRTAFIRVSTEMLADIDYIRSEIDNELRERLGLDIDDQLLNGDNIGENLNGIVTQATPFSVGTHGLSVVTPNLVDVLTVSAEQVELANFMPTVHVVHPADLTTLRLAKVSATDSRYVNRLQDVAGTLMLDGIPVVANKGIAQGKCLTMDGSKATVFSKGEMTIEIGLNNDDFTKNFRTILAEWRGMLRIKGNDKGAFVYADVAAAITALTKP